MNTDNKDAERKAAGFDKTASDANQAEGKKRMTSGGSLLLLPVLLAALAGLSPEGGPEHNRDRAKLKGAVHTVSSETAQYLLQDGEWRESLRERGQLDIYDAAGRLREHVLYNPDGTSLQRKVRSYDEAGRVSEETVYAPDGSVWHRRVWTYNEHGGLTAAARYEADGTLLSREIFTSHTTDHPVESVNQDKDGTFLGRALYRYNAAGQMIERSWVDDERKPLSRNVYGYDTHGNLTSVEGYDRHGTLSSRWVYRYDEAGNRTEWIDYQPDGSIAGKQTYAYAFDANGNWIKKVISDWVTSADGGQLEPSEVIYRTLTYYPDNK